MPKVIYVSPEGIETQVDLKTGTTLMEGALYNSIDGIDADCGGSCACATCHIYVDKDFLQYLPEISEYEEDLLEQTNASRKENSRLSCQIQVTDDFDGIKLQIPDCQ